MDEIRKKPQLQPPELIKQTIKPEPSFQSTREFLPKPKNKFPKKIFLIFLFIIIFGAIGFFIYDYWQGRSVDAVEEVSKIYLLPENEDPTVATVTDISKLRGKQFFINAKEGDKVLIYDKADLVILYNPVTGKIVNVDKASIAQITP